MSRPSNSDVQPETTWSAQSASGSTASYYSRPSQSASQMRAPGVARVPPKFEPTDTRIQMVARTSTSMLRDELSNERAYASQLENRLVALEEQTRYDTMSRSYAISNVAPQQRAPFANGAVRPPSFSAQTQYSRGSASSSGSEAPIWKGGRSSSMASDTVLKVQETPMEDEGSKCTPVPILITLLLIATVASSLAALLNDNWATLGVSIPIIGDVDLPITLGPLFSNLAGNRMSNLELIGVGGEEGIANIELPGILDFIIDLLIELIVPNLDMIIDNFIAVVVLNIAGIGFAAFSLTYFAYKLCRKGKKVNQNLMALFVFLSFMMFLISTQLFDGEVAGGIDQNGLLASDTSDGFMLSFIPLGFSGAAFALQAFVAYLAYRDNEGAPQKTVST